MPWNKATGNGKCTQVLRNSFNCLLNYFVLPHTLLTMKLTYIYHSGFAIEGENTTILIDYYKDTAPHNGLVNQTLLSRPGKFYVLCTHSHPDHFNPEILTWKQHRPDIQYIFSKDILYHQKAQQDEAIFLDKLESYSDDTLSVKAFGSTDIGVSFRIETAGKKIFHAGDLNNWHWNEESTKKESMGYERNYLKELEILANDTDYLDLAMFPVDPRLGKDYMRGAQQFINRIKVTWFTPMHFGEEYGKANAFSGYAEKKGCLFAGWTDKGQSIKF